MLLIYPWKALIPHLHGRCVDEADKSLFTSSTCTETMIGNDTSYGFGQGIFSTRAQNAPMCMMTRYFLCLSEQNLLIFDAMH
mmetsp:Transcript_21833/g.44868  ORF Transcript_21833/g.44868 Transcript_21833/m.44868 type:complete len:82 (-) Transcript_21833:371-616(-)